MSAFPLKLILCPTDFSELATFALGLASDLASCSGAALLVMHAEPFVPPVYFTAGQIDELAAVGEQTRQAAEEYLHRYAAEKVKNTVPMEVAVSNEHPVSAILNSARARNADLIVMGTHGRSGLSRVMLGSVTERVLREAGIPVLSVRAPALATGAAYQIRRVLCPVDFTPLAAHALEYAVCAAECFGSEINVLTVIESSRPATAEREAADRLSAWIPAESRRRCPAIRETVRRGDAAGEIIGVATAEHCDLIVLGAQHKPFADATVLGVTTIRVTRHAPCPVLTTPISDHHEVKS